MPYIQGFKSFHSCGRPNRHDPVLGGNVGVAMGLNGMASFRGLLSCGSVWICPVCSAKITERRSIELSNGIKALHDMGGEVYFGTFTVPHTHGQPLKELLDGFQAAWRRMVASRAYKQLMDRAGSRGTVRGLEFTYGVNGWHPHIHALFFTMDCSLSVSEFRRSLYALWEKAVRAVGIGETSADAFDLRAGRSASKRVLGAYVAGATGAKQSWGLEREVAKAPGKRGKGDSYSPFDFLRVIRDAEESGGNKDLIRNEIRGHSDESKVPLTEEQARRLFLEYGVATRGLRQLVWSRGLRDWLELGEELTDKEIADKPEVGNLIGVISEKDYMKLWRSIRLVKFLESIEDYGWDQTIADFGIEASSRASPLEG